MQEVRIEAAQQGFGKFRIVVVEFLGGARIEQGAGLDQAPDVRIFAAFDAQAEGVRQPGILLGEFAADRVQVDQFAFVVWQQLLHPAPVVLTL